MNSRIADWESAAASRLPLASVSQAELARERLDHAERRDVVVVLHGLDEALAHEGDEGCASSSPRSSAPPPPPPPPRRRKLPSELPPLASRCSAVSPLCGSARRLTLCQDHRRLADGARHTPSGMPLRALSRIVAKRVAHGGDASLRDCGVIATGAQELLRARSARSDDGVASFWASKQRMALDLKRRARIETHVALGLDRVPFPTAAIGARLLRVAQRQRLQTDPIEGAKFDLTPKSGSIKGPVQFALEGTTLALCTPSATTCQLGASGYFDVPAGDYQVMFSAPGKTCTPKAFACKDGTPACLELKVVPGALTYASMPCQ